jgi:H+/Cl- antiporter ClcA
MNASFDSQFDPNSQVSDSTFDQSVRGEVVNRTHRVVRQRAKVIKARRTQVRSLMLPLIVCSVLLILSAMAVWSGLYQTQAAEAVQDVASLAPTDTSDEFLVVLLWFVPVSLAILGTVWLRRAHTASDHGTTR